MKHHRLRPSVSGPLVGLGLLLLSGTAAADIVTGRVVDANGNGVANVDIDAFDALSGNDVTLSGDFTDAAGFFTTTIPAGLYDLDFLPPAPPTTTHLAAHRESVAVVGTVNLGTITLPAGVALSGRCVTQGGVPVAGVNLDVVDETTGLELDFAGGISNAFGNFSVAVPTGPIEVRFDTRPVLTATLAPVARQESPTGTTNLGDVVLPPGFDITGFVRRTNGTAVANCDMDVRSSATGTKLWTPGDNTTATGSFSIRVAAGTWDVEACPQFSTLLVAAAVRNVAVNANTNVGTLTTPPGVALTGNVVAFDGSIQASDIDVADAAGNDLLICGDNTDASGNYAVVVPTGTLTVTMEPTSFLVPYGADVRTVNVTGATVVNGVLPSCPGGQNYGTGLAGLGGFVPHLTDGGGTPRPGNENGYFWSLENGRGGANAILMVSTGPLNVPALGGTILVNILPGQYSAFLLPLSGPAGVGGAGSAQFPVPVPIDQIAGVTLYGQFGVIDPAAPANVALSDGMSVLFCF